MAKEQRTVDNRVLLLGLDGLYRTRMKRHEGSELLDSARIVARELAVSVPAIPVEGYYAEDALLAEYFRIGRALKQRPARDRPRVAFLPEFAFLERVFSSPIFGIPRDLDQLLPGGGDSLTQALSEIPPSQWSVESLASRAKAAALESEDVSLVGLASWLGDPVVLAATRESCVLYAEGCLGFSIEPILWRVDPEFARLAGKFIDSFNALFKEDLPAPLPEEASQFWQAYEDNSVVGRCVCLGTDPLNPSAAHYHWGIAPGRERKLELDEFWDKEVWTTDQYRRTFRGIGQRR